MRYRMACHLFCSCACFGWHAQAANPEPLVLEWVAPPTCTGGETVRREVLRLASLDGPGVHRVHARVRIQRLGDRDFELRLSADLDGVEGERTFRGQSCDSVTDAAALTLALMLNPDAEVTPAEPAPAKPTPAPRSASEPGPPAAQRKRPPSEREEISWALSGASALAIGVRTGVLPDPGLEVAIAAGAGLGPLRGWLGGSIMPAQSAAISGSNAGGRMWVLSGTALAAWALNTGSFEVAPSLGIELTRVAGRGAGVTAPERASIHWTSAIVGGTAHLRVSGSAALGVGVFGLVPLARPSFYLDDLGPVFEPQVAGIRTHFSAVWLML